MENTVTINVERYDELRKYEEAYKEGSPITFTYEWGRGNHRTVILYKKDFVIEDFIKAISDKNETIQKVNNSLSDLWINFNKMQVERDDLLKAIQPKSENKKWWQKLFS